MVVGPTYIWRDLIPGNKDISKTDVMDIHQEYAEKDLTETYPGIWDKTSDLVGNMSGNDTLVYRREIANGPAVMTYQDKPFLLPRVVERSKKAVIICPGGAYLFKSMLGEGEEVARFLNNAGISAFILWYRTYPYRAPFMYLDCQRAVRYVRYHAKDYGIDPEKIALLGFSAGGNLAAVSSLNLRDGDWFPEDYQKDDIDRTSAHINALGLVYPALVLDDDKILSVISGKGIYNDKEKRGKFAEAYRAIDRWQEGDAPTFICSAMDDNVVVANQFFDFVQGALNKSIACSLHLFPYGGHGFGACQDKSTPNNLNLVQQWPALFTSWLEEELE